MVIRRLVVKKTGLHGVDNPDNSFCNFTVFQGGYVYEYQFRPHHSGVNTGTDDPTTVLGKERKKLDPACLPLSSSKVIVGVGGSAIK